MLFLGRNFVSGQHCLDYATSDTDNLHALALQNGIYNNLYVTKDISFDGTSYDWDNNTIMHAEFNETLHAGNVDFALNEISSVSIKRREKGNIDWVTLFEVPIASRDDLQFIKFDRTARGTSEGIEYEYALVPTINGVEGNININSVHSKFFGLFIMEKDKGYTTLLDVSVDGVQKNKPKNIVQSLGSPYPIVISNGAVNYYSGSASGVFVETDTINDNFKIDEGFEYRKGLMEFLNNGLPKILKNYDGRIWLVLIASEPKESVDGHKKKIKTQFDWVEIGDANSANDLKNNDLL